MTLLGLYVAFKRQHVGAVELVRYVDFIGISTVVLGELFAGFRCGSREAQNRLELERFLSSSRVELIDIDEQTAEFYAEIYRGLRVKGQPIPTNDLWIAASSLRHGLAVATYDEHFKAIDGLLVVT
ncbi:type II toxin-antitoxin system VapC family toxin [Pelovirga terrestris]|uniref:Type II toxin-antitoxin system VapC family toxin n=1 Tax=Pelovirga terrestris TaxID=2771352 RepID=A0A8J6QTM4_9BACT|nr:type II toxin-antitoxin system VapC family toxin [Pelovirga terrestris]MBD1399410.1 type II toxin-antitoxin system VapC family toxin [Pelovirga terrestris]